MGDRSSFFFTNLWNSYMTCGDNKTQVVKQIFQMIMVVNPFPMPMQDLSHFAISAFGPNCPNWVYQWGKDWEIMRRKRGRNKNAANWKSPKCPKSQKWNVAELSRDASQSCAITLHHPDHKTATIIIVNDISNSDGLNVTLCPKNVLETKIKSKFK